MTAHGSRLTHRVEEVVQAHEAAVVVGEAALGLVRQVVGRNDEPVHRPADTARARHGNTEYDSTLTSQLHKPPLRSHSLLAASPRSRGPHGHTRSRGPHGHTRAHVTVDTLSTSSPSGFTSRESSSSIRPAREPSEKVARY